MVLDDCNYTAHLLVAQCIVIGPVCMFVSLWRAGGVCYHANSKLHASILTKLGL